MSMKSIRLTLIFGAISMGSAAMAATGTGSLTVTATVLNSCTIGSAALVFGTYNSASATPTDAQTTVLVTCTNGAPYEIYSTTALASRVLTTGVTTIPVSLDRTMTYGIHGSIANRSAGAQLPVQRGAGSITGNGTGLPEAIGLFGRIAPGENVIAGAYTNATAPANLSIDY